MSPCGAADGRRKVPVEGPRPGGWGGPASPRLSRRAPFAPFDPLPLPVLPPVRPLQDEAIRLSRENCRDIIACGVDPDRTFIFSDFEYMGGQFYRNVVRISGAVTTNQARGIFGFDGETCIGKVGFPAVQAAPAYPSTFPHWFGTDGKAPCLGERMPPPEDSEEARARRDEAARVASGGSAGPPPRQLRPGQKKLSAPTAEETAAEAREAALLLRAAPAGELRPVLCLIPCAIDQAREEESERGRARYPTWQPLVEPHGGRPLSTARLSFNHLSTSLFAGPLFPHDTGCGPPPWSAQARAGGERVFPCAPGEQGKDVCK